MYLINKNFCAKIKINFSKTSYLSILFLLYIGGIFILKNYIHFCTETNFIQASVLTFSWVSEFRYRDTLQKKLLEDIFKHD